MNVRGLAQPLVGRARELAVLDRLAASAAGGAPAFAVVWGEPGIGKTRLLAELGRRAGALGQLTLHGRAGEFERGVPFGVVVDALDPYLAALEPRAFDRLAADGQAQLAAVFPALGRLASAAEPGTTAADRHRIHQAVSDLLERLAARQPLLLALDDLHWADDAAVELVAHLLRRPPRAGVLIAASLRHGTPPQVLASAIAAAERAGWLEQLELGPLTADDADALIDGADPARRRRIYELSGGNPFYLEQLVRHEPGPGGLDQVTRAVAASIRGELGAVSPRARALAAAAAVAGDPFEIDLAIEIAELDEAVALDALDELAQSGLLAATDLPRRFRLRHPLVRRAVYESIAPGTRLALHGRAAAALTRPDVPPELRASHVEAAARPGDRAAVEDLTAAGNAVAGRDPAAAAHWFGSALRLLGADRGEQPRLELLTAQAAALAAIGRFEQARAALVEALALTPAEALDVRVRLTVACAGVEQLLGRQDDAHARLRAALERLPDRASGEAAQVLVVLGATTLLRGDYEASRAWAQQALERAEALGDPMLTASTVAVLAAGCAAAGAGAEAAEHHARAAALVDAMADEQLAGNLGAIGHLLICEHFLDRFEQCVAHARRGLAVARATRQGELLPLLTAGLATPLCWLGGLAEAVEVLDGAVEAARLTGDAQGLAWALMNRAYAAQLSGDLDYAQQAGEESVALARTLDDGFVRALSGSAYATVLIERGKPRHAAEILTGLGGGEELPLIPAGKRCEFLELLVRCRLALGQQEEAARSAAETARIAEGLGLPVQVALGRRAAAGVALGAGDAAQAAQLALDAAEQLERGSAPLEGVRSRLLAARALTAAGDRRAAVAQLERAEEVAVAYGAEGFAHAADRELRRLGRRRARRSHAGSAKPADLKALTPRERELAELVTARRTNRQIAAELFLSEKTVETHLRNIFFKLGVSSRVQVAELLESARAA